MGESDALVDGHIDENEQKAHPRQRAARPLPRCEESFQLRVAQLELRVAADGSPPCRPQLDEPAPCIARLRVVHVSERE